MTGFLEGLVRRGAGLGAPSGQQMLSLRPRSRFEQRAVDARLEGPGAPEPAASEGSRIPVPAAGVFSPAEHRPAKPAEQSWPDRAGDGRLIPAGEPSHKAVFRAAVETGPPREEPASTTAIERSIPARGGQIEFAIDRQIVSNAPKTAERVPVTDSSKQRAVSEKPETSVDRPLVSSIDAVDESREPEAAFKHPAGVEKSSPILAAKASHDAVDHRPHPEKPDTDAAKIETNDLAVTDPRKPPPSRQASQEPSDPRAQPVQMSISIGRIEIEFGERPARAAPTASQAPARTRGFDAYARARRGDRR